MKELGINEADRVKYEHAHLCDMLHTAMIYEQLDCRSLGCFGFATPQCSEHPATVRVGNAATAVGGSGGGARYCRG